MISTGVANDSVNRKVATGKQDLVEVARNLRNIQGTWQFQVFSNCDELVKMLKDKLSEADYRSVQMFVEIGVKHPIRRQMGRLVKAIEHLGDTSK